MANEFLPFAGGAGANVLDQATYAALTAREAGFAAGIAKSPELNKVWRQASFIAAMVAQFAEEEGGVDMLDNGDLPELLANFKAALGLFTQSQAGLLMPFRGIQVYDTAGAYTWAVPDGVTRVWVHVRGAGGGGGRHTTSAGGGGAGGGVAEGLVDLSAVSSVPVTVGAGGVGRSTNGDGANGGSSSFGAYLSGPGGAGGFSTGTGGNASPGVGGAINYAPEPASGSQNSTGSAGATFIRGGNGGGLGGRGGSPNGSSAQGPGGGGGGAYDGTSGNGGDGLVTILW